MERMPEPGDLIEAFSPQPGRCFRMVQSRQLQATHCRGEPAWKGQWQDRSGRSWYVEACRDHAAEGDQRGVGGLLSGRVGVPPSVTYGLGVRPTCRICNF